MISFPYSSSISSNFSQLLEDYDRYTETQKNNTSSPDSSYFSLDLDSSRLSTFSECSNSSDGGCQVSPEKSPVTGCRKRKRFTPQKSSYLNDPNFRGVTIVMENRLVDSEWKFIIKPTFTLSPKKKKKRKFKEYVDSSEEDEIIPHCAPNIEEKHCASCSAKKTPLWRDAEDGTPLCNACGIRYKKYKMRCGSCWHIPKKDEFHPRCRYCGSTYEYVSPRR